MSFTIIFTDNQHGVIIIGIGKLFLRGKLYVRRGLPLISFFLLCSHLSSLCIYLPILPTGLDDLFYVNTAEKTLKVPQKLSVT